MKKLRVGLVGLGGVAEAHLEGYKEVEQIEVIAGAEINEGRLNQMTEKWDIKGYTSYEKMLKKENLDIVSVLTPARFHREVTEKVAEQGVHVFCEKPMAVTLEDAKAMIEKCKKEGVKFCYGASYRFLPACRKAKEMIDTGKLGDILLLIEVYIGGKGIKNFRDAGPQHYPVGGPGGGGMGLMDHGIHLIDMFMWLTGNNVESVFGRGNYSGQRPSTEYLTMILKNGAVGQLVYNEATFPSDMPYEGIFSWGGSWDINYDLKLGGGWDVQPQNFRVHGTEGALRVFHYANKLFFFGKEKQEQIRVLDRPMPSNFALQMASFAKALLDRTEPEVTGLDGLKALQVALAAYESYETQKIVKVKPIT
jgi:predicted dehydrogenase